jgi:Cu(I)/Ag(I) efflux system membrane protein CusA/SilA
MNLSPTNESPRFVHRVIWFCAHNRLLVIGAVAALVVIAFSVLKHIRLDAIPDLSDTQVIVYTKWDRSPDIVEDQVTYPIVSALLGAPKVKAIRGLTDFGFSFVYVIFEDGTDIYWARSRVLEYMQSVKLPDGAQTELGPDATGVGWVFQYALVDKSGKHDLAELRAFQDWSMRYALQTVPGVSEVAGFGGFEKQYQVTIDPVKMQGFGLGVMEITEAIKKSNNEVGGRLIEWSGREYMVRARGYITDKTALEQVVVKTSATGTPVLLRDVADIAIGPQLRRAVADYNGEGDVVGGIVVMRHGENALNVINRVKTKLAELKPSLPAGVEVVTTYDRSQLIRESIQTLTHELTLTMIVVSCVILFFLWHIPSALVPIITIPVSVLIAFIPMYLFGITSNIMSLAGIAISIGVLVDGAIVEVENAYKKIEHWQAEGCPGSFHDVRVKALMEVGPSVFLSLAVIAVSFLPIFALEDMEGRMFSPLAYTKTLTMILAAGLAVTLDPALRMLFARYRPFEFKPKLVAKAATAIFVGKYFPEENHPVSRVLINLYDRPCRFVLRHPWKTIVVAVLIVASAVPVYLKLGREFMPPLFEGTLLYMPTTVPGMSITQAAQLMQVQDRIIKSFPEVVSVHGKAGRSDTATDPAPINMLETVVVLKPKAQWRPKKQWYTDWAPGWLKQPLGQIWPEHISFDDLKNEMTHALQLPGYAADSWTMPIKGRIDMLSTGIRSPLGVKIFGDDLHEIQRLGEEAEKLIGKLEGTGSVFAERAAGGYFVDFVPNREALARYGLTVDDLHAVIMTAIGGENITTTVEGRQRFTVNLRYPRDFRQEVDQLERVLVKAGMDDIQVPIKELADIKLTTGPAMIRNENGRLAGYLYVTPATDDIGRYAERLNRALHDMARPPGYEIKVSGQYENMVRVKERLKLIAPVTLLMIFFLLYFNTKSVIKTAIVLLAVPFSAVGAIWFLWMLDYNISIAVWVGIIALMGLDAETGVFMLMFLDLAYDDAKAKGRLRNRQELIEAVIHGAVKRIRPKMMTVGTTFIGLMPILWSTGTGADMMKRVAAPLAGGLATSFVMELMVYPAIYLLWKWHAEVKRSIREIIFP